MRIWACFSLRVFNTFFGCAAILAAGQPLNIIVVDVVIVIFQLLQEVFTSQSNKCSNQAFILGDY